MKGHIHILGICGTFMGGMALLARELGYRVTGSDANVYPPMSTQLAAAGIELMEGYEPAHLQPAPDCVVVGNALSRGNAAVELAITLPVMVTILFGSIEICGQIFAKQAVETAAYECARDAVDAAGTDAQVVARMNEILDQPTAGDLLPFEGFLDLFLCNQTSFHELFSDL